MSSHVVQGLVFNCSICCFLYYFLVLSSCVIFSSSFCVPVFFPQPSRAPCVLHLFPLDWFSAFIKAHFFLWIRLFPCPHLGTVFVYLTAEGGGWYEWMGRTQSWYLSLMVCLDASGSDVPSIGCLTNTLLEPCKQTWLNPDWKNWDWFCSGISNLGFRKEFLLFYVGLTVMFPKRFQVRNNHEVIKSVFIWSGQWSEALRVGESRWATLNWLK